MLTKITEPVYLKDRDPVEFGYERRNSKNDSSTIRLSGEDVLKWKNTKRNNFEIQDDVGMPVNYVRIRALEDSIRKGIISDEYSLYNAIIPVITLAHYIALLPVQGTEGQNTSYLIFKWFSWPILYVIVVLLLCFLMTVFSIIKMCETGFTYNNIGDILFFGCSLVIYILFIHLAREWPKIMAKWELMEREMKQFGQPHKIAFKFKVITSIVVLFSTIEQCAAIVTDLLKARYCSTGGLDIFRVYFTMIFHQVFSIVHYSVLIAVPLEFLNVILSFAWNYMDLFIVILAYALSDKFKQLNQKLATDKGKVLPSTYWRKSRENYNLLASLTRDFDEFLSPVIILSFAHNLYSICLQLLNSLKPMHSTWEIMCFVFLFTYLVGRTCAVSLYAASINDQSKKPKAVLFSVPTESYGVEVARFLTQVASDELALTGWNFFSVTRTFLLTVVGTIVTYEIVLIQFNNMANVTTIEKEHLYYCP